MAKNKQSSQVLDGVEKGEEPQEETSHGGESEVPTHDEFGHRIASEEEIKASRENVWKSQLAASTESQIGVAARLYPAVQGLIDENQKLKLEIEALKAPKKS